MPECPGSFDDGVPREVCRKDTGQGKKLRKWSRGHQFIVCGGDTLTRGNLCIGMFRIK